MIDDRTFRAASENGIYSKILALYTDLREIKFVTNVDFDIMNYHEIPQVIFLLEYDIRPERKDYWTARRYVLDAAIEIAKHYDLIKTEDAIEDYGQHFYFVFSASKWKSQSKTTQEGE